MTFDPSTYVGGIVCPCCDVELTAENAIRVPLADPPDTDIVQCLECTLANRPTVDGQP